MVMVRTGKWNPLRNQGIRFFPEKWNQDGFPLTGLPTLALGCTKWICPERSGENAAKGPARVRTISARPCHPGATAGDVLSVKWLCIL